MIYIKYKSALRNSRSGNNVYTPVVYAIVAGLLALVALTTTTVNTSPPGSIINDVKWALDGRRHQRAVKTEKTCKGGLAQELKRLSTRIRPTHYDLVMHPNGDELSFDGVVKISFQVEDTKFRSQETLFAKGPSEQEQEWQSAIDEIVLHADPSLKIHKVLYLDQGGAKPESSASSAEIEAQGRPVNVCRHASEPQMLVLRGIGTDLKAGSHGTILISFSGRIRKSTSGGIYRSPYRHLDEPDTVRYLITTNFEPDAARRAFPCFDEPNFKATFSLTLIHEPDLQSLANTDPQYETTYEQFKVVSFEQTPPMSPHLVAFTIGEFDTIERRIFDDKVTVRVRTPPGFGKQGQFALETACRALPILSDFFGLDFPLKKVDLVGVNGLKRSAMENWGLVTLKNDHLLVARKDTSAKRRAAVAGLVVGALAHHWFGNLVTMDWWTDNWLNEGFVTWLQFNITHQLYPKLQVEENYVANSLSVALQTDSWPIVTEDLAEETEIDNMFDPAAYHKAAAIVRSLHLDYIGPEPFRAAVQRFMAANQYGNAKPDDLWRDMEAKSGRPVREPTKEWIRQTDHPLVKVDIVHGNALQLSQEPFPASITTDADERDAGSARQVWLVPMSVLVSDGAGKFEELLKKNLAGQQASLKLPDWFNIERPGHWLKVNANFSGPYQVDYSTKLLNKLRGPIETKTMRPIDRYEVISEAVALLQVGRLQSDKLLQLLGWFKDEDSGLVLDSMVEAFRELQGLFVGRPLEAPLKRFGRNLFGSVYRRFGFDSDLLKGRQVRIGAILSLLVDLDHNSVIDHALQMFAGTTSQDSIEPEYRETIYKSVAREGSESQYEQLFTMFKASRSSTERNRLAIAILSSHERRRINKAWLWLTEVCDLQGKVNLMTEAMLGSETGRGFIMGLFTDPVKYEKLERIDDTNKEARLLALELASVMGERMFETLNNVFRRLPFSRWWLKKRDAVTSEFRRQSIIRNRGADWKIEALLA